MLLASSTVRKITERHARHARKLAVQTAVEPAWPTTLGAAMIIVEVGGGMVALVETDVHSNDHRCGAHRYIVQQRLKRPGAWWTSDIAAAMRALRLARANDQWSRYPSATLKQAA